MTRFSMSLEPSLGTMPLSSVLSQLHVLCVVQLLLTPRIICLRYATQISRLLPIYVISHAQSYRGPQNPQWLSEVVMARAQTCYPQMESRDFDHAANPTCCLAACTGSQFVHVCIYAYRYGLSQQLRKNRRYVRLRKIYVHNRGN